jgi:hypothetical protein
LTLLLAQRRTDSTQSTIQYMKWHATKLVTARLPGDSLTDTSRLNTNLSNIRLYSTEEQIFVCSSFLPSGALFGFFMELLWNFPCHELSKMEVKMEVSILELYYSVILCVCER